MRKQKAWTMHTMIINLRMNKAQKNVRFWTEL